MLACGMDYSSAHMSETEFYVSHECLLLDYESALTREDSTTGLWCARWHALCTMPSGRIGPISSYVKRLLACSAGSLMSEVLFWPCVGVNTHWQRV